jgi:hypothetical protein
VLRERGAGRTRERLLVGELRIQGDELAERLEIAELQIRRLPQKRVDVGRELLEIDAHRAADVLPRTQLELASGVTALPEPLDHALQPRARPADNGIGSKSPRRTLSGIVDLSPASDRGSRACA